MNTALDPRHKGKPDTSDKASSTVLFIEPSVFAPRTIEDQNADPMVTGVLEGIVESASKLGPPLGLFINPYSISVNYKRDAKVEDAKHSEIICCYSMKPLNNTVNVSGNDGAVLKIEGYTGIVEKVAMFNMLNYYASYTWENWTAAGPLPAGNINNIGPLQVGRNKDDPMRAKFTWYSIKGQEPEIFIGRVTDLSWETDTKAYGNDFKYTMNVKCDTFGVGSPLLTGVTPTSYGYI